MSLAVVALLALGAAALVVWAVREYARRRQEVLRVVTHNLLSDAHLDNFARDVEAANQRARELGAVPPFAAGAAVELDRATYAWERRAARIAVDLGAAWLDADVQCLQEVTSTAELPAAEHFDHALARHADDANDLAVVRWRRSRFRICGEPAHLHMGRKKPAVLVCLEAVDAEPAPWRRLVVLNLHHPGGAAATTDGEMAALMSAASAAAGAEDAAWIVAGDFNCVGDGAPAAFLRRRGFREAGDAGPPLPGTFFADAYGLRGAKVDHIFYRPPPGEGGVRASGAVLGAHLDAVDVELLAGRRPGRGPLAISDHRAVAMELRVEPVV